MLGPSNLEVSSSKCFEVIALRADDKTMNLKDIFLAMNLKIREFALVE